MKLTCEEIKSVTFGAREVIEKSDGNIYFERFTSEQANAFAAMLPNFRPDAVSTTGCRLDFHTDSRHVLVQSALPGDYEVLVDGLQAALITKPSRIELELPEGDTRVTVLLPDHNYGALRIVYLDQDAYLRPHTYDRKFLFLGDSITQGHASSRPSMTFANRISQYFNAQVVNWGVGGSHFDEKTLAPIDYDPDVIFIGYGTNDFVRLPNLSELEKHCDDYMDKVNALFPGKQVFCITPIWRADNKTVRPCGIFSDVRQLIAERAQAHGYEVIDGYTLVPHMTDYYSDEYLHPNDIGFSYYAENLIKRLTGNI